MGFDSVFFISCLLPVGLILYWLIPGNRGKNALLLLLSLLFYAFGSISALGLLLAAAVFNFLWGRLLRPGRKILLILGVGANLAYLFVFKYRSTSSQTVICPSTIFTSKSKSVFTCFSNSRRERHGFLPFGSLSVGSSFQLYTKCGFPSM